MFPSKILCYIEILFLQLENGAKNVENIDGN